MEALEEHQKITLIPIPRVLYAFLHEMVNRDRKTAVDPGWLLEYLRDLLELPVREIADDYYLGSHSLKLDCEGDRFFFAKVDIIVALYDYCFGEQLPADVRLAATQYNQKAIPGIYLAAFKDKMESTASTAVSEDSDRIT